MSEYCEGKMYYGDLEPELFGTVLDFADAAGVDFVWHLNMAFGRGYNESYVPWDPTPALPLIEMAGDELYGALLFEEMRSSKTGFKSTKEDIAQDLSIMKASLGDERTTLVYGVLDQDSDQKPSDTDSYYNASSDSVDVVCFSFYMNNAAKAGACPYDAGETALFLLDASARATLDATAQHFVELAATLGKPPPHLTAGAPCTHAPEGTGWGAVNAHAGALWYADALGRAARSGVGVFARQTLFGGAYGLLDNTTYLPTPGYYVALLHSRLFGEEVLNVTDSLGDDASFVVYGHCARQQQQNGVALLLINFDTDDDISVSLPEHSVRTEWVLTAGGDEGLLSKLTVLNGNQTLVAGTDGSLPAMVGRQVAGGTNFTLPPASAAFVVLETTTKTSLCD